MDKVFNPSFFDQINGISTLSNFCEHYCSPGVISEKYGRKFKVLSSNDHLVSLEVEPNPDPLILKGLFLK